MTLETLRVPVRLPSDPARRRSCIRCVEQAIGARPGVHAVRVTPNGEGLAGEANAAIELDYERGAVEPWTLKGYAEEASRLVDDKMGHIVLPVEGLNSPRSEHKVQAVLNKVPGVQATACFATQTVRIDFDRQQCALPEIVRRLEDLGIRLRPAGEDAPSKPKANFARRAGSITRRLLSVPELALAFCGGLLLVAGAATHYGGLSAGVWGPLLAGSYVCCGWLPAGDVVRTLARLRFDIDVLMVAAAVGAASLGHYEEGALLLLLFSLGGGGQRLAMDRAREAIRSLARLAPQTATVVDDTGEQREVGVEQLCVGDRILVRPGERIGADGRVVGGGSSVDQAPITGESAPIEKAVGDGVFAGTINGEGALTVEVTKPAGDTTLARVVRLVEEAQATKSPTQLFTDKVERFYVPVVLAVTAGLIVVPPVLGLEPVREDGPWAGWFYQAMAFLTAASPCALAIGTPAAVLSGIGRAARAGVLVKGGAHLENLALARAVAFDKTGTLTLGRPDVTDVVPLGGGVDEHELLSLAAAVERVSQHPLATAIVAEEEARQRPRLHAERVEQVSGAGVFGWVGGRRVSVGRLNGVKRLGEELDPERMSAVAGRAGPLEAQGKTVALVVVDGEPVGLIGLADQPRPGAARMITQLRKLGVRETVMLTGDNEPTAKAIAKVVGVDHYYAELLPEDKLDRVRELERTHGRVAMVGDGVNDAPALACASVGIAIGGATGGGSDAALETADVALLSADLGKLVDAVRVARKTKRIMAQNLVVALGVIAVVAPIAAAGYAPIYTAVMLHEGSTVLVVLNALRILALR